MKQFLTSLALKTALVFNVLWEIVKSPFQKETPMPKQPVGHFTVDFPREFPTDSLLHLAGYIRGKENLAIGELMQHGAIITGCAGKLITDEAPPTPIGATREDFGSLSNEAIADRLEQFAKEQSAPRVAGAAPAALPAWLLPMVLQALLRAYQEWQNRK